MLNIALKPQQLVDEHKGICPNIYSNIDLTIAPKRYRKRPGANSSLWKTASKQDKKNIAAPHLQELFRQWAMAGDPVADAYAARFADLKHGNAMNMLNQALEHGIDSVADAPPELIALMAQVDHVPQWVDWDAIDNTSDFLGPIIYSLAQTGWRAGFVLTFGNSYQGLPMVLTGALHKPETTPNRIKETISVVNYLAIPNGLRRDGKVLKTIVKVRMMHALVRVNLLRNKKAWDTEIYGVPLPQADMYGAYSIAAPALAIMQKLHGKPININALRYLMYLTGIDPRIPNATVEELNSVKHMLGATLKHMYEPWASELTEASLSAKMKTDMNWLDKIIDKADRQLGELAITKAMGEKNAAQLGVTSSWRNYFSAAFMLTPVIVKFSLLKLLQKLPNGKARVRNLSINYAAKNMGIDLQYNTNPKGYRQSLEEAS